jgi:two-component system cell cycle response regulator DivK
MATPHALIIDDNVGNVTVLENLLSKQGLTHTRVVDPAQLPVVLNSLPPTSVVFLDLEMPGQNGYDILHYLRNDERFRYTPIVAFTVHLSEVHTAHQQGFNSFIGKPLDTDRFPDQLQRILRGEGVWEWA